MFPKGSTGGFGGSWFTIVGLGIGGLKVSALGSEGLRKEPVALSTVS